MKATIFIVLVAVFIFISCEDKDQPDCNELEESLIQCTCDYDYNPVCGCNGTTYGNACAAECLGITIYEAGECNSAN